jgi:putative ABC transport system substrate-binding protein
LIRFLVNVLLIVASCIASSLAGGEDSKNLPTIGLAIPVDPETDRPYQTAFREGLRDLGYVDGKNVRLIVRYSNGGPAKLRAAVQEPVDLKVDVLWGDAAALQKATSTIPIVAPAMGDPVKVGLVSNLARPEGNLTGLSGQGYEITSKQLELAKELLPDLKQLCLLFEENAEPNLSNYANVEFRALARDLGIAIRTLAVRSLEEIRAAKRIIDRDKPQALMIWLTPLTNQYRDTIMRSAASRLPVIGEGREFAKAGAVLTYSVDYVDLFRRSASYVDKILKGAKPGDLPIEQPTKFELIVNLKTAKALGITIPESILLRADELIR